MFKQGSHFAHIRNAAALASGWALVALGVAALPIPGPFTMPTIALGGMLLVRRSRSFRCGAARIRIWFPESSQALSRKSHKWPRAIRYVVLRTDPSRFGLKYARRPATVAIPARLAIPSPSLY